ncbi:hypothetical protein K504DRAFT_181264 [Pleomassaria siparia CBS 279.74]|uniref:Uncharacterized protein n=1 Tax=Pleomassaria siparia CBS 279.74 TaxID=1314801 RepID=A0A6G1JSQ7_9PLEO|nr:hypothetical protein K504DRAFT_181264 [Pleomassaria siparia CBS 279.74]
MACNTKPSHDPSTINPIMSLLKDIQEDFVAHHAGLKFHMNRAYKIIMHDLILRPTPLSTVEVQAKELEAEALISHIDTLMAAYKTDIDRLPADVLSNLGTVAGAPQSFTDPWALKKLQNLTQHWRNVTNAVDRMKAGLYQGRNEHIGWEELKASLVRQVGSAELEEMCNRCG